MTDPSLAVGEERVQALAFLAGLRIAPSHLPGVVRNLAILMDQARILGEVAVAAEVEPAAVFHP